MAPAEPADAARFLVGGCLELLSSSSSSSFVCWRFLGMAAGDGGGGASCIKAL